MENRNVLTDFIKRHEGFRLEPYKDTRGKWTVYYGRNISDVPTTPEEVLALLSKGSTKEVADLFFKNDLVEAESSCRRLFVSGFERYSENRQIALISVMFNLGVKRFKGFKKMIHAVYYEKWDVAHDELLDSLRARQVPGRSKEEALMLKRG